MIGVRTQTPQFKKQILLRWRLGHTCNCGEQTYLSTQDRKGNAPLQSVWRWPVGIWAEAAHPSLSDRPPACKHWARRWESEDSSSTAAPAADKANLPLALQNREKQNQINLWKFYDERGRKRSFREQRNQRWGNSFMVKGFITGLWKNSTGNQLHDD